MTHAEDAGAVEREHGLEREPVAVGQELELAVDYTCLHCFDPDTGDALQTRRDRQPVP